MKLKRNIYIMYAMALLQGMVFYGPVATLYRQAAGVSIFEITLIESISMALTIFLELPWGVVADKIGYKRTMVFCSLLYLVSKVVFWQATGFGGFLAERIMLSMVIAGLSGVEVSILYGSVEPEKAQGVFGVYNNCLTTGLIAAATLYSLFIKGNYALAGFLTVVSYGAAAILSFALKEVKPAQEKRAAVSDFKECFLAALENKRLIFLLIGVALLNETHQTITVFLNQPQYVRCGIPVDMMGYIYAAVTLAGLLGGFSLRLTKKIGEKVFGRMLFITAAGCCLLMAFSSNALAAVGSILLLRIAFSLFQPLQMQIQNREVKSPNRATALSLNAVLMDGVAVVTNLGFGALAEVNLSLSMLMGAALCLCGLALFSLWGKSLPAKA